MTATTAAASVPTTSHTKRSTPSELSKTCGAGASGRRGEETAAGAQGAVGGERGEGWGEDSGGHRVELR
jgi:hypothetical protein